MTGVDGEGTGVMMLRRGGVRWGCVICTGPGGAPVGLTWCSPPRAEVGCPLCPLNPTLFAHGFPGQRCQPVDKNTCCLACKWAMDYSHAHAYILTHMQAHARARGHT